MGRAPWGWTPFHASSVSQMGEDLKTCSSDCIVASLISLRSVRELCLGHAQADGGKALVQQAQGLIHIAFGDVHCR